MNKTYFDLWTEDMASKGIPFYRLEGDDDTAMYMSRRQEKKGNEFIYSPVFHVWNRGESHFATLSYHEAIYRWKEIEGKQCDDLEGLARYEAMQ